MKIAVWGAGTIGTGLVYRLATTAFTSEIRWINRSYDDVARRVIDLEQGLDFAPTCHRVKAYRQEDAPHALADSGIIILTLGKGVKPGGKREDLYPDNRDLFRESVLPSLRNHRGVILVISNPVDLMARLIFREAEGLSKSQVVGLGTVVETARLRASLGQYLSPARPAREVWAFAVGTHDERFVPVATPTLGVGAGMDSALFQDVLSAARREVARGANRIKSGDAGAEALATLHPIAEGAVRVCEAIALDQRALITVSVLDPETPDSLFYSVPCTVGAEGIMSRHTDNLGDSAVKRGLEECREGLRACLRATGD